MIRLLEIELRKLLPTRDFRLSLLAYIVLLPACVAAFKLFSFEVSNTSVGIGLFGFPDVWLNVAYLASWMDCLLYVIVLQIVTSEYQLRTLRQNVIDGLSRREYVIGKAALLASIALASTVYAAAIALLAGWIGSPGAPAASVFEGAGAMAFLALQLCGYLALALLIGTLARKPGAAILAFFAYVLAVEPLSGALMFSGGVSRHLPSSVFAALVPNPFYGYVGMRVILSARTWIAVTAALYTVLLMLATQRVVARQDL